MKKIIVLAALIGALIIPSFAQAYQETTLLINAGAHDTNTKLWFPFYPNFDRPEWISASNFRVHGVGEGTCWRRDNGGWTCKRGNTYNYCDKTDFGVKCKLVNDRSYSVATSTYLRAQH